MKKTLLIVFVFFTSLSLATAFQISRTQAGEGNNSRGWVWGGSEGTWDGTINGNETGIGWISMNELNCDANGDGDSDGTPAGCPTAGTRLVEYGANVPPATTPFPTPFLTEFNDGDNYVWNSNIGWISFRSSDLENCPSAPCTARREGDNLKGWARILGIKEALEDGNSGGWQGWIKLGTDGAEPPGTPPYGVAINPDRTLSGYAWNGEDVIAGVTHGLGWIDFSGSHLAVPKTLEVTLGASPSSCYAPCPSLDSTLTAGVTGGTAEGDIKYEFDCMSDGNYEAEYSGASTVQSHSCSGYTDLTNTASVRITRDRITEVRTALVAVGLPRCGNDILESGEACDDGDAGNGSCPAACSDATSDTPCQPNTCQSFGNWKEVSP